MICVLLILGRPLLYADGSILIGTMVAFSLLIYVIATELLKFASNKLAIPLLKTSVFKDTEKDFVAPEPPVAQSGITGPQANLFSSPR